MLNILHLALLLLPLTTTAATTLLLTIPPHIPPLPPTTRAILSSTSPSRRLSTPITRANTFLFRNITSEQAGEWLLDIACRDWDFMSYGVDVVSSPVTEEKGSGQGSGNKEEVEVELYRVGLGGVRIGEKVRVGGAGVEVRVLRGKEYYEARSGCESFPRDGKEKIWDYGNKMRMNTSTNTIAAVSPIDLLKNPMILIGIVGLGFVFGMPYLLDNMDPEMKAEFEEQQKKSILRGGANAANPLQNFDMAAWMAGKTAGTPEQSQIEESASGSGAGTKTRRGQ